MKKIAMKLVKVMEECGYVQKNGVNDFHKYKYATCADVLEKVNAALTKHQLASIVVPELVSLMDVTSAKGNIEHLATVKINITLFDAESGETVTITGIGSGQDNGDKAVMKAQTAAIKYAYLLSLAISTGDDPEEDNKTVEKIASTNGDDSGKAVEQTGDKSCSECGALLTKGVYAISTQKFGKPLCPKCQKNRHSAA